MRNAGVREKSARSRTIWALAALLGAVTALPAAAAPEAARWDSRTSGLAVRAASSLRIIAKGKDVWYASIAGSKSSRMGLCESRNKGETWTPLRTGLEDLVSERDRYEITLDPKDEKVLYAVWRGKIFKSTSSGQSWEYAGSGTQTFSLDRSQNKSWIAGLAIDPSNSKRLVAGTLTHGYHGGLFESKDGGKSWSQLAGTGDRKDLQESGLGHDAWPIALDKSDKFLLVGGLTGSAWFSDDRGVHFKLTQPGAAGLHRAYAYSPMESKELFLAESRGLWRSRERGESWEKTPRLQGVCLSVDVDPGNRKQVYAVMQGQGLYRTDNLTTWDGPKHPELDISEVVVHPHAKNTIFVASSTTGLSISTDRGDTFTSLTDKVPESIPAVTHATTHPRDPNRALAVSESGLAFSSVDRCATWRKAGYVGFPVTRLLGDLTSPDRWIAAGAGVAISVDGGAKWEKVLTVADPEDRIVDLQAAADGTLLALWERDGRIYVSRDAGKTWEKKPLERALASKTAWASSFALDSHDPKHILVAMRTSAEIPTKDDRDGGPFESKDGGATWALVDAGLKSDKGVMREGWNRGAVVAIDGSGAMLYGADGLGLVRFDPSGADGKTPAWVEVGLGSAPTSPTFGAFIQAPAALDGAATEIVMQVEGLTARALLRSVDGGKTWVALPDPGARLRSLSADPAMPGRYMTGDAEGDRGVLVYEVPGSTPPPPPPPTPPAPTVPSPSAAAAEKPAAGLFGFTASEDGTARAWDLHEGAALPGAAKHEKGVVSLLLSKDGSRLYTGGADKIIGLWNAKTCEPLGKLEGHAGAPTALAVSPDGTRLYSGDNTDWKVYAWDVASGKSTGSWAGHTGAILALVVSPDGHRVYSASGDHTVRVWDADKGTTTQTLAGSTAEATSLALSADGTKLYVGGRDASVRVFDAVSCAPLSAWETKVHTVHSLALSPDGATLYVASDLGDVVALGTADGKPTATYAGGAEKGSLSVAVSADGEWIAAGGEDGLLRLWKKGKPEVAWKSGKEHAGRVLAVVLATAAGGPPPPEPAPTPAMGEAPPMGEPPMGEASMAEPPMGEPAPMAEPPSMGG